MRVTCARDSELGQVTGVVLEGDLDAHGATHFRQVVSDRLSQDSPSLLIDMSGVKFLTSAGVGVLMQLLTSARNLGGSIVIYGCSSRVLMVFKVVGLGPILNVCDSEQEARDKIRELHAGDAP